MVFLRFNFRNLTTWSIWSSYYTISGMDHTRWSIFGIWPISEKKTIPWVSLGYSKYWLNYCKSFEKEKPKNFKVFNNKIFTWMVEYHIVIFDAGISTKSNTFRDFIISLLNFFDFGIWKIDLIHSFLLTSKGFQIGVALINLDSRS